MTTIMIKHEEIYFSLEEICERATIDIDTVIAFVDYGIVEPTGEIKETWQFSQQAYLRINKALRLKNDLGLNNPGVALALELMDNLQSLRDELEVIKTHYQIDLGK